MGLNTQVPTPPTTVPYADLGGGMNTRLDPHALARNELAVSINLWSSYDNAIAKRPGSQPLITTTGVIGIGAMPTMTLMSARFNSITWLVHVDTNGLVRVAQLGTTSWYNIGSVNANAAFTTCAQMFDPNTQKQQLFICDGMSTPQYWDGVGTTPGSLVTVPTGVGYLPNNYLNTAPITPQYVKTLGNNSLLFYSGEPTNTSAVYVSDPFYPTQFNYAAQQITTAGAAISQPYYPAIIGNNDGVEGGIITGMETIGSIMVIFKQAAIYAMVQTTLLGEVVAWQVIEISNSTGNLAPRSLARFDSFICFLGVDGVYITDGMSIQSISDDVPTYFDSSLDGNLALCTNRTIAIGVRHGKRYEIWFPTLNMDYCNTGLWFDFAKQSRFGHPLVGEIDGMNVGGATALRGPSDTGNIAWGDALIDKVGQFGIGFSDYGAAISTEFWGKADLFDDVFGPEALVSEKQMQDAYLLVEMQNVAAGPVAYDFYGAVIVDLVMTLGRVIEQAIEASAPGGQWGELWGTMQWGSASNAEFFVVKIPMQNGSRGRMFQIGIKESSVTPWVILGYAAYVNPQKVGY